MGRKNNLLKYQNITNGDMSAASITSDVTDIQFLDNVGLQLQWTGSPVGTFSVQVSADYAISSITGAVTNPGTWSTLPPAPTTASGSPIYIDLNQLSAPFVRVVYTKTSGSGTLQGYITAKALS